MPGLEQLKRFNQDMLSMGNEAVKRAARGEKPITVPIPATVKDADDSDDFVLGMPEEPGDMNGGVAMSQAEASAVDVSDLIEDVGTEDAGDIDFSQFEDTQAAEDKEALNLFGELGGLDSPEALDAEPLEAEALDAGYLPQAEVATETAAQENNDEEESDDAAMFDDSGEISLNDEFPGGIDNVLPDPEGTSGEEMPPAKDGGGGAAADDFDVDSALQGIDFGGLDEPVAQDSAETATLAEAPTETEAPAKMTAEAEAPAETLPDLSMPDDFAMPAETAPSAEESEPKAEDKDALDAANALDGLDFGGLDALDSAEAEALASADTGAEDEGGSAPETPAEAAEAVPGEDTAEPLEEMPAEDALAASTADDSAAAPAPVEGAGEGNPLAGLNLDMDDAGSNSSMDVTDALAGLDLDNLDGGEADAAPSEEAASEPIETFSAPEMEGVDFSLEGGGDSGFELDENALHIPGFTDTETAADVHARPSQRIEEADDSADDNGLPPNTLTEKQYAKFRSNFAEYPLNVRQAFEKMIVQNEFTDDAQFEVVEKILKKSSARHVASHLEKMLDVSLPVPRDYERRTASEYAAYKSSFKYQLYNRIIPAALVCLAGVLLAVGLFMFCRKFIYRPIVANKLYKQGYALLEADEYPQSETRFVEATKYKMMKKWFYKYAQGYRERKQYQRAEKMYKNILYCFDHDKQAGIEYAQMECYDLANYEKAEEVARREVLDYHINDPDGILLLGDVFLEWGTEKDPSKFEEAKKQYALLVQLYGPSDLYMSRMMRYFIRTDNLREVLPLKEHFYTSKKAHLAPEDWTELSGFMLDKLYGTLAPGDEELRIRIEDVMDMLRRAVRADPSNPVAMYNLSRYYVKRNSSDEAKNTLVQTLSLFNAAPRRGIREMYKELDTYRMLGEEYVKGRDYIKAQEIYTDGITLYEKEKRNSGFAGDANVGRLYADAGDIDYFIRGDMDGAFNEYTSAVETKCDTPSLRYRLGYISYNREDYDGAVNSFIKAAEDNNNDTHLLLAMANTLSLRDDNYGAQSYYERLMAELDNIKAHKGILLPQVRSDQAEIVDMYLKASNNLGVTLGRLAHRTGNSRMNADAFVNLTTSMRAWDALTRNQETMVRLKGSNLAEQNLQYLSRPISEFEPAIYTDIPRILNGEKELKQ